MKKIYIKYHTNQKAGSTFYKHFNEIGFENSQQELELFNNQEGSDNIERIFLDNIKFVDNNNNFEIYDILGNRIDISKQHPISQKNIVEPIRNFFSKNSDMTFNLLFGEDNVFNYEVRIFQPQKADTYGGKETSRTGNIYKSYKPNLINLTRGIINQNPTILTELDDFYNILNEELGGNQMFDINKSKEKIKQKYLDQANKISEFKVQNLNINLNDIINLDNINKIKTDLLYKINNISSYNDPFDEICNNLITKYNNENSTYKKIKDLIDFYNNKIVSYQELKPKYFKKLNDSLNYTDTFIYNKINLQIKIKNLQIKIEKLKKLDNKNELKNKEQELKEYNDYITKNYNDNNIIDDINKNINVTTKTLYTLQTLDEKIEELEKEKQDLTEYWEKEIKLKISNNANNINFLKELVNYIFKIQNSNYNKINKINKLNIDKIIDYIKYVSIQDYKELKKQYKGIELFKQLIKKNNENVKYILIKRNRQGIATIVNVNIRMYSIENDKYVEGQIGHQNAMIIKNDLAIRVEPHRKSNIYCRNSVRKNIREIIGDGIKYIDNILLNQAEGVQMNEGIRGENITNRYSPLQGNDGFCVSWTLFTILIILLNLDKGIINIAKFLTTFNLKMKSICDSQTYNGTEKYYNENYTLLKHYYLFYALIFFIFLVKYNFQSLDTHKQSSINSLIQTLKTDDHFIIMLNKYLKKITNNNMITIDTFKKETIGSDSLFNKYIKIIHDNINDKSIKLDNDNILDMHYCDDKLFDYEDHCSNEYKEKQVPENMKDKCINASLFDGNNIKIYPATLYQSTSKLCPNNKLYKNKEFENNKINSLVYKANPTDVKPTDVKPTDVKPTDVKPTDVKPTDVKPTDVNLAKVKPTDVKPTDVKPTDVKLAKVKPTDVKPTDVKPTDVKPTDVKPTDVKPIKVNQKVKPTDVKPIEVKPTDVKPIKVNQKVKPTDVKPTDFKPIEVNLSKTNPSDINLTDANLSDVQLDSNPIESKLDNLLKSNNIKEFDIFLNDMIDTLLKNINDEDVQYIKKEFINKMKQLSDIDKYQFIVNDNIKDKVDELKMSDINIANLIGRDNILYNYYQSGEIKKEWNNFISSLAQLQTYPLIKNKSVICNEIINKFTNILNNKLKIVNNIIETKLKHKYLKYKMKYLKL